MRSWLAAVGGIAFALAPSAQAGMVPRERVETALTEIERMAEELTAADAVPGIAIAVVHDDETVFLGGFGVRTEGGDARIDGDTVFQIASMSKPISATVVAGLVSDGTVAWDSRIADLNPAFRLHDAFPTAEVTLSDLFNHTSGLPGTSGDDLEAIGFDRLVIGERLRLVPPSSSFRSGYSYSNAGLTQGALAAAMAAGQPWEEVAEARLYSRIGMAATSSRHADFVARTNRASLHFRNGETWDPDISREPDAQAPAGGVSSTVRDLAEWMRLELGNGVWNGEPIIAPSALAATHAPLFWRGPDPVSAEPGFYGLGWNVSFGRFGPVWSHAGAFSNGARTRVTLWPESDLGIIVLVNAFPSGVPEGLSESFADLVFEGSISRDWVKAWDDVFGGMFGPAIAAAQALYAAPPDPATPALPGAAYAGVYANDYVGEAEVAAAGDGLEIRVGPEGRTVWPLDHFDRDVFIYYPDRDTPGWPSSARFEVGPDGRATAVTLESLDSNGLGRLTR